MSKTSLCDGNIDCDNGMDEDCYRPCCQAIKFTQNEKIQYFIKNIVNEDGADIFKDTYADKTNKTNLYNKK